jgi:cellulose synthase/poly-beta-1,6-N-acetylglucosamine synthase-like glycosyltransferase
MAEAIYWVSLGVVLYVYVGYPCLLLLWRAVRRSTVEKSDWEPTVTIIIAAWNERARIGRKLTNCLELDYSKEKLQIVVSLDGPSDGTEEVVRRFENDGVEMLHSRKHLGKAAALNAGVERASGEVLVFADARQMLDRAAIRELVSSLGDESVGAVSGELVFSEEDGSDGVGSNLYWRYEKRIRALESEIHSILGATGALYAIRRELFEPVPESLILDDVAIPLRTVLRGRRAIFDPGAKVFDRPQGTGREYARKVRTLLGNYQLLTYMPEVLSPSRNPVFIQFVSHKIGRLLVPYFLLMLFAANLFLRDGFYLVTLGAQCLLYLAALAGSRFAEQNAIGDASLARRGVRQAGPLRRVLFVAHFFVMMNWAAAIALVYFLRGREGVWVPQPEEVGLAARESVEPLGMDRWSER